MSNETENLFKREESKLPQEALHSYDGIDELDNALPRWWVNGFYLTILFALGYFGYYIFGDGPTLFREYEHEKTAYDHSQLLLKGAVHIASESEMRALVKDSGRLQAGRAIFQAKCVACHGALGQGGIGPNLTDDYWIHGSQMTEIFNVVNNGVLDKGMPPWGPVLKADEVYSVVAYVKSLRGTRPPGAKAPQGALVQE